MVDSRGVMVLTLCIGSFILAASIINSVPFGIQVVIDSSGAISPQQTPSSENFPELNQSNPTDFPRNQTKSITNDNGSASLNINGPKSPGSGGNQSGFRNGSASRTLPSNSSGPGTSSGNLSDSVNLSGNQTGSSNGTESLGSTRNNSESRSSRSNQSGNSSVSSGTGKSIGGSGSEGGGSSQSGLAKPSDSTSLGGRTELSDEIVFVVESEETAYWRTGAYVKYNGDGWSKPSGPENMPAEFGRLNGRNVSGEYLEQRIIPKQPMYTVPAAWKPIGVGGKLRNEIAVTPRYGIRPDNQLRTSTSYVVYSRLQNNRQELSSQGFGPGGYPEDIRRRYTQLPDVPSRVGELTDRITATAVNDYQKALRIEEWLRENKDYSLNVGVPQGDFVDGFLFEMDSGYCEYFATSMVVMLRTQDIPSRYVVGYTPGEEVNDGRYVVRGMDAHAWVEAYFPRVGWVKFDPTPASPREQSEGNALGGGGGKGGVGPGTGNKTTGEQANGINKDGDNQQPSTEKQGGENQSDKDPQERNSEESSSSEESQQSDRNQQSDSKQDTEQRDRESESQKSENKDKNQTTRSQEEKKDETGETNEGDDDSGNDSKAVDVDFKIEGKVVPGNEITVIVTADGERAQGYSVKFNGDLVGVSGSNGVVNATVPFSDELVISIGSDGLGGGSSEQRKSAEQDDLISSGNGFVGPPTLLIDTGSTRSNSPTLAVTENGFNQVKEVESNTKSFRVNTDLTTRIHGQILPTRNITLKAIIDGIPLRHTDVTVNGAYIGETGENGSIAIQIPYKKRLDVSFSRGDLSWKEELNVNGSLDVEVNNSGLVPIPLPTRPVDVYVTFEGLPVEGAEIRMNGEIAGNTNSNGHLTAELPIHDTVEVKGFKSDFSSSSTLENIMFFPIVAILFLGILYRYSWFILTGRKWPDFKSKIEQGLTHTLSYAYALLSLRKKLKQPLRTRSWLNALVDTVTSWSESFYILITEGTIRTSKVITDFLYTIRGLVVKLGEIPVALYRQPLEFVLRLPEVLSRFPALLVVFITKCGDKVKYILGAGSPEKPGGHQNTKQTSSEDMTSDIESFTVEEAWGEMANMVYIPRKETKTPGEIAGYAVKSGLPSNPVHQLTNVFRESRYADNGYQNRQKAVNALKEIMNTQTETSDRDNKEQKSVN